MSTKRWMIAGGVVVGLAAAAAVGGYFYVKPLAYVGTGYTAHRLCSCVFVSGRSEEDCMGDLGPSPVGIDHRVDAQAQTVVASIAPLATSTATYHGATGCRLDPPGE